VDSDLFSISFNLHFSNSPVWAGGSWDGTEVLWEESGNMVVGIVSIVECEMVLWVIVSGMSITGVGVTVVINDWVIGVVFPLEFLVVGRVSIGEFI
jgi:hypothetical protein